MTGAGRGDYSSLFVQCASQDKGDRGEGLRMLSATRMIALAMCACVLINGVSIAMSPSNQVGAAAADDVTLTIGIMQDPDSLNPFSMVLGISYTILYLMYDTLNSVEPDLSPGPQLAESWYHSEDGTVWYYNITHDAYWHDTTAEVPRQVTANDIAYTYNLVKDNENKAALWTGYIDGFDEIVAVNDFQLRITTDVPKATMLSIMVPVLPMHIWELIPESQFSSVDYWGADAKFFPNGPVGSGPFVLNEWVKDDFVKMLTWDQYYLGVANFDVLMYKVFDSIDGMATAITSGYIDVATDLDSMSWETAVDTPDIDGQSVGELSLYELGVNCASAEWREAFKDASDNLETTNLSVRQAIAMCVNKTQLVAEGFGGYAEEGSTIIPTATPAWHYDVPEEEIWNYDLDAAGDLLDAAGYPRDPTQVTDAIQDGVRKNETNDVYLDFVLNYRLGYPGEENAAERIAAECAKIGIKVDVEPLTESQLTTAWFSCSYDLYIWGWDCDVDPSFMLSVMTTDQIPTYPQDYTKWSDCYYSNPYYDQLYLDQLNAVDFEDRQAIIWEMQQILYRDCPYVVLWYPSGLYAYRTDTFFNYPDMNEFPGTSPGWMWFFFAVIPYSDDMNMPPYNVNAGGDMSVDVNTLVTFSGEGDDPDDDDLNWTWDISFGGDDEAVLYGQVVQYTFAVDGEYVVTLTVTDPGGLHDSDSLIVTVLPESTDPRGNVTGYAYDGEDNLLSGVSIVAGGKTSTTGLDGRYNLSIAPGTYSINASKTGYALATESVEIIVNETAWVNFTLTSNTASVSGIVTDEATGAPMEAAIVRLSSPSLTKWDSVNETGWYVITGLAAGTYSVNVTYAGYVTNTTSLTVSAGDVISLNFTLAEEESTSTGGIGTAVLAILGAVIALIVVAVVVSWILKKRRGDASEDVRPDEPGPPEGS